MLEGLTQKLLVSANATPCCMSGLRERVGKARGSPGLTSAASSDLQTYPQAQLGGRGPAHKALPSIALL